MKNAGITIEKDDGRIVPFHSSFVSSKVQRENAELHKTSAWLAEQARSTERAIERARYRR